MNAGFSSLAALKAQLLASSLRARTDWDVQLTALGLGVAAAFDTFCNRKFARVAGDLAVTTGGRASWIVPRYPVEAITALDVRDTIAASWIDSLLALDTYNPEAGTIYFTTPLDVAQIRVTYTGGYWWNVSEVAETPDVKPDDATAIPADVVAAWHMQCEAIWRAHDKLGTKITKEPDSAGGTAALTSSDLSPTVQKMLGGYIRYALT